MRCLLPLLLTACAPEIDLADEDVAPRGSIVTPSDGSVLAAGPVALRGVVSDPNHPPEQLFVVWSLGPADAPSAGGWRDVCTSRPEPDGTTLCATEVTADDASIRLFVTDPTGFQRSAFAALTVLPTSPPGLTLVEPTTRDRLYVDVPVRFEVEVDDPDHPAEELTLRWTSSEVGPLDLPEVPDRTGVVVGRTLLPRGDQVVSVQVTDPDGATTVVSEYVTVGPDNGAPRAAIAALPSAAPWGDTVDVVVRASDPDVAPGLLDVRVESDLDGELGTGIPDVDGEVVVTWTPSRGDHRIVATVTDETGERDEDVHLLHVSDPPTLEILQGPADGDTLEPGSPVVQARLTDDLDLPGELDFEVLDAQGVTLWSAAPGADGTTVPWTWADLIGVRGAVSLTYVGRDAGGLETRIPVTFTIAER